MQQNIILGIVTILLSMLFFIPIASFTWRLILLVTTMQDRSTNFCLFWFSSILFYLFSLPPFIFRLILGIKLLQRSNHLRQMILCLAILELNAIVLLIIYSSDKNWLLLIPNKPFIITEIALLVLYYISVSFFISRQKNQDAVRNIVV